MFSAPVGRLHPLSHSTQSGGTLLAGPSSQVVELLRQQRRRVHAEGFSEWVESGSAPSAPSHPLIVAAIGALGVCLQHRLTQNQQSIPVALE